MSRTAESAVQGKSVIVVGAGLAGPLLSVLLARLGASVRLYERRSDPLAKGYAGGRSINLALSCRGLTALRAAGLDHVIAEHALPMRARLIHPVEGELSRQPYSSDGEHAIMSVSRGGLNAALVRAARETPGVTCEFEHTCVGVDIEKAEAQFTDATGQTVRAAGDVIIGTDGAFSAVREAIARSKNVDHSVSFLSHAYKELTIPPAGEIEGVSASHAARLGGRDKFAMDPGCLHIWPRGSSMMIALPNLDGSFTVTLFWPYEGEHGFAAVDALDDAGLRAYFARRYPDAAPLLTSLEREYHEHPTGSLVTVRCFPWHAGRVMVLGDAAHAIVPFYGQGMNCAFEDCRILGEMLAASGDLDGVIKQFDRTRKPDTDAIADMAVENFLEMRDKVASRWFRARQRIDHTLARGFPRAWVPRYHMISFTNIPYAEARARARRQWAALSIGALVLVALVSALIDVVVAPPVPVSALLALGLLAAAWARLGKS